MTQPPQGWPGTPQPGEWQPNQWQQPQAPAWQQPVGTCAAAVGAAVGRAALGEPAAADRDRARKSGGRGKLIAAVAVAVAVVAGGAVTYQAVSDKNAAGAASPKAAVQTIVADLNNSDLIGVLDDLAPGERAALASPAIDAINDLKRLHVLQQAANPSSVSGVQFKAQDLTFASQTRSP